MCYNDINITRKDNMQPNQGNNVPNRPVVTRRPVNARPTTSATARVPEDAGPTFDNGPSIVGSKGGRKTGWVLAIILLLLIAAGGVGFGVWAYMDGNNTKNSLNAQIVDLQRQNSELQEQLEEMAIKNTNSDINVESNIFTGVEQSDSIVLDEWGIKIQIGEPFVYTARSNEEKCEDGDCSIRVTALTEQMRETVENYPNQKLEDIVHDVTIVKTKKDEMERVTGETISPIFNDGEYNYFVLVPSGLSLFSGLSSDEMEYITNSFDDFVKKINAVENYSKI